jgi:hypothetical protein
MTKTKPQKLTRAVEKRITEDWAREFTGMGVYKRRWLMRRVGPLLIGVSLDRDSHGDLYKRRCSQTLLPLDGRSTFSNR